MASIEQDLRDALTRFMRAAAQRDKETVTAALGHVTELQKRLGPDAPEMLRHYLERRSYQKALELLNSGRPETEPPQCGH